MKIANGKDLMIICGSPEMIKDAYINHEKVLVLRQVKFDSNGSVTDSKVFRLMQNEVESLLKFWRENVDG